MLRFFFNRNGVVVKLMEALGVVLNAVFLFTKYSSTLSGAGRVFFWVNIAR